MRTAELNRKTKETDIYACVDLDGGGIDISTGIGFFDHMLCAVAKHSGMGITLKAKGDLDVDCHHTVEDVGIVLGRVFKKALENSKDISRYGSAYIPMDESLAFACADISGRPFLRYDAAFSDERVGIFECCLAEEFFRAFAYNAGITLHVKALYGTNSHHKIEAMFKALAYALRSAIITQDKGVLSTKGVLD